MQCVEFSNSFTNWTTHTEAHAYKKSRNKQMKFRFTFGAFVRKTSRSPAIRRGASALWTAHESVRPRPRRMFPGLCCWWDRLIRVPGFIDWPIENYPIITFKIRTRAEEQNSFFFGIGRRAQGGQDGWKFKLSRSSLRKIIKSFIHTKAVWWIPICAI